MPELFGADGIRGKIYEPPLDVDGVTRLGRSIGAWLEETDPRPVLLVGTDTRESRQWLKATLIDSLNHAGVTTVDADVLPTAAVSYLVASKGFYNGGLVISASHNPINENGIKLFNPHGMKISDQDEAVIEDYYNGETRFPDLMRWAQNRTEPDYAQQYASQLAGEFNELEWNAPRLLVDCANGAAYQVAPLVFQELGFNVTLFNAWPDGTNINRQSGSEYIRMSPQRLVPELSRYGVNIGIALDGDADRVVFVDADGRFYDGDLLLAILALKYKRRQQLNQDKVVATCMSNSGLEEYLDRFDIHLEWVRNGDKYVSSALVNENLVLGGEQIGHLVLHNHPNRVTGDGIRTALAILAELAENQTTPLTDLAAGFRKWPQVVASIALHARTKVPKENVPGLLEICQEVEALLPDVRIRELRPASTEPAYRIMLEARLTSKEDLADCCLKMSQPIQAHLQCDGLPIHIFDCVGGGQIQPTSLR